MIVEVTDGNFTAQKEVNIELQNVNDNIPEIIYPTQGQTVHVEDNEENIIHIKVSCVYV